MAVDYVCMDALVKLDDSTSNSFRDIRGADFVSNERTRGSLKINSGSCLELIVSQQEVVTSPSVPVFHGTP